MSLSKRLFVELSPYSLQIAVMAGDRLEACREFALDAKDALASFAAEHAGIPVSQALLVPRVLFSNLSSESEAASIRSRAALLEYAVKAGGKLDEPVSSVVCDATTGLAPEEGKNTKWLLTGTTAANVEAAKQQLASLGMPAESSTLALPADLGAVVTALAGTPSTRVAVWQLNESDSTLWLVSASGVEKASELPTGFNQIFDAVQAELGLKFRTAAAKLFLNNTYDFTDLATGIADRLKGALAESLASLGGSPTDFRIAGLSGHQAWLGQAMAKALNLKSWSPDMAAVCGQFGLSSTASAGISPSMLGLLKAASGAGKANSAWLPGWLDAQPAPAATPAPEPEAAAVSPAPTKPETPAAKTQPPTAKAPGQLKVPAATARPQVTPTKPLATGPLTAGLKTAQVATSTRTSGPATTQGAPKKKPIVPIVIAGVVVAGLAVVGMKMAKGDGQAEKSQAPPAHPPIPESTVAYYRFENGPADSKLSTQPSDTVADISPNGYHLMVYGDAFFDANVPTPTIQGATNKFCAHFKEPSNLSNIAVQSLNSYVFKDFTIETYVKFDSLNNVQTVIGRDIDPRSNAENLGPTAIFYLQKGSNKQDPKKPDEVPNSFQLHVTTPEKKLCSIVSPVAARVNIWHHLAVVGNAAKKTLSLYVDGILVGQSTDFTGMLAPKSNSGWTFGRGQYDKKSTDWLQGSLDEIRFSNVALSPEQFVSAQAGK